MTTAVMNPASSSLTTTVANNNSSSSSGGNEVADEARELAGWIHNSGDIFLERLITHLSQLPALQAVPLAASGDGPGRHEGTDRTKETRNGANEYCDAQSHDESLLLKCGMTLPALAVAWLSDQLEILDRTRQQQEQQQQRQQRQQLQLDLGDGDSLQSGGENVQLEPLPHNANAEPWIGSEAAASLRHRFNVLRRLLPRAQLIRLNRQPWPPTQPPRFSSSSSSALSKQRLKKWWGMQRQLPSSGQNHARTTAETDPDGDEGSRGSSNSSSSSIENSDNTTRAFEFLQYAGHFPNGGAPKCVRLHRSFPNARILVLEGVPPSWIDLNGAEAPLRVITVRKAAIYNLEDFLPTLSEVPPYVNIPTPTLTPSASRMRPSLSSSLTHLKLEGCSLGELTKGFASSLSRLTQLEYLSLRQNEFRTAKTLLKGLRPLTRLRYLDVSSNRLVGCFGPYANLCLGGQVRTLLLSNNLLTTCKNSGLEKCFALREIWLDSNRIEDVLEISGLAGLPELQCLVLQDNPFSTKPKTSTKTTSLSSYRKLKAVPSSSLSYKIRKNRSTNNSHYDRDWKIRLWTWFQQERHASTPLELPLLKRRSRHKTFKNFTGSDSTVSIGRMTREQWDQVQEKSFSSFATSASSATTSTRSETTRAGGQSPCVNELHRTTGNKSNSDNGTNGPATSDSSPAEIPPVTAILGVRLMAPICNPRVTRKSKTRKIKIHTAEDQHTGNNKNCIRGGNGEPKRRREPRKNKKSNVRDGNVDNSKVLATASQKDFQSASRVVGRANSPKSSIAVSSDQKRHHGNVCFRYPLDESMSGHALRTEQHISFSLEDVLVSLYHENQTLRRNNEELSVEESEEMKGLIQDTLSEAGDRLMQPQFPIITDMVATGGRNAVANAVSDDDTPNNPFANDPINLNLENEPSQNNKTSTSVDQEGYKDIQISHEHREEDQELDIEVLHKPEEFCGYTSTEEVSTNGIGEVNGPEQNAEESSDDCKSASTNEASNIRSIVSSKHDSPRRSPQRATRRKEKTFNEDRIFVKPKVATIQLSRMSKYRPFDALTSDWEELVKKASEGGIPDGLVKSPAATPLESPEEYTGRSNQEVFSEKQTDLLATKSAESTSNVETTAIEPVATSRSASASAAEPSILSNNRTSSALPELIFQDDNSVLSSLGASRDDIMPRGRVNKFQLAEENSSYDGPDSSRGLKVFENLELYFDTFVFPTSMPDIPIDVLAEMEEDEDDWQLITMYHPRIQLWPDDRRLLERTRIVSLIDSAHWTANRERFCRVWAEDIIPCGKPALSRLPPNRRIRLSFHGDKLFENGNVDAYSECRKVLLCLSTKALYVILEKDDVTSSHQQQANKRRFPLPLDRGDRFRDAPWPHAVARHPLGDLEAICIGFEFQRLTLRFRNPSLPGSDPFVYILLTGDKRTTVRILQETQKLAKEVNDNNDNGQLSSMNGENSPDLPIENDAHIVLDSLNSVIESSGKEQQSIGTIMHFQIVQQRWKRGDRGTVRRVVVITDTMLLLLDEDYAADGHDLSSITITGEKMADVRYRLVDCANLSLVSQVQAASSDPRAITILIKPSKLSLTHRWRLICRDREGAERLVEDARKALEIS